MMIGVLAPTTTSDTFPAVLMGIPGTAGSQATVMDGFPLSKKGMAAKALSAAFSSSLLGGVFGAVILSISIYYAIPIIMTFGFGEQFLLVVLALLMVGALTGDNFVKGITACCLGLIIGSIGTAPITGDLRYTFGTLYLVEGGASCDCWAWTVRHSGNSWFVGRQRRHSKKPEKRKRMAHWHQRRL